MNELMIYQVFPLRALTDGQPSHGILEMIDWIPHIKKLGMNAVYFHLYFHPVIMDMIQKIIRRSMRDLEPMKTLKRCVMPCMKKESR